MAILTSCQATARPEWASYQSSTSLRNPRGAHSPTGVPYICVHCTSFISYITVRLGMSACSWVCGFYGNLVNCMWSNAGFPFPRAVWLVFRGFWASQFIGVVQPLDQPLLLEIDPTGLDWPRFQYRVCEGLSHPRSPSLAPAVHKYRSNKHVSMHPALCKCCNFRSFFKCTTTWVIFLVKK